MLKRTPLHDEHLASGAKMVDFSGWEMPIHYGSQIEEHHQVRQHVGMFDVSHMTIVDVEGDGARAFLGYLLANNVDRLRRPGKALYSCMLNEQGGIVDDLIVYFVEENRFRMVVNAATREKDLVWIRRQAARFSVRADERQDLAMIAVQGPEALRAVEAAVRPADGEALRSLRPFNATRLDELFVARTGYTGEDGFETMVPGDGAPGFWQALSRQGVPPIGLGARDTLRLEAGLNLYGSDMDESTTPLEAGLAWTVAWEPEEREFIGRQALEKQRQAGPARKLVGLVLEGKGVLRNRQKVFVADLGEGEITSGSFSPTLGRAIALARVPAGAGAACEVEMRGKRMPARIVKPPFVRRGKSQLPDDV
ncbi:MAG: glycine cleavage system aminomethyltransferase GcvT [Gammaproteobacteria bacterium]|nr:glycine cleavage system aminomethyltransferase GcvT [Gammaproteobacteria bacterium]NIR98420.1 glycine cleavage system aminomethyltransferase GcvT [Gammaproteobacteria bacterium]NIT64167.1 glycine cleavage system aminomethyltransferase GcvT [Gammaproteobacteria bacterium]NIV21107.1 glycine cleavage system aminomethyltransferase GcvT [Gammaproteobacteria bacterium]NIX10584.1 glycine cleavage system aminomethyltransferase GcvT [Gammaproteobacteria bacterium]